MSTPLTEVSRVKLLPAYIGDVRAWKADDATETIIFAVKNPAVDSDDTSFYALPRGAAQATYLGTTVLGKDGGVQPLVYNDGTVAALITETPLAGQSGSLADLYLITFANRLTAEPAPTGTGNDVWLRGRVSAFMAGLRDLAARFV
jgi:hypothetical protein